MANDGNDSSSFKGSDSGTFLLDPEEKALLKACADRWSQDEELEVHRRFLKIARELPAVRLEKVLRIRKQIADGTYLSDDKLEGTVDRILEALR